MPLPPGTIPSAPSCGCMLCDFGHVPMRDVSGVVVHTAYRDGAIIGSVRCEAPPQANNSSYGKVVLINPDMPVTGCEP